MDSQLPSDLAGNTLVSILFTQELNWQWVVGSDLASGQILAWMPVILNTALGLTGAESTKTWMLQVHKPASYSGPQDVSSLGTTFVGYIPTNQVNNLAQMIKAPQSVFYSAVNVPVALQLAQRVDSGYSLLSLESQDTNGGDGGGSSRSSPDSATGGSNKTRQDAIIGVVSALGAVAFLVLAFLGYRWYQRRSEHAHRRLSDPIAGARPEGREFDQDSLGGQRRRSFYFAEDSLRGYQQGPQDEYNYYNEHGARTSPVNGMTQRRPAMPGAISQPILQSSSMNW